MRRGEVINVLGINEAEMTKIVRAGLLKPVTLRPHVKRNGKRVTESRHFFLTQKVQEYWDQITKQAGANS